MKVDTMAGAVGGLLLNLITANIHVMNKETSFNQLTLRQKYRMILNKGEFISSRIYGGYQIHLFTLENNYVEVWRSMGLNYIHWIEIVKSAKTLENYIGGIQIKDI